MAQLLGRAYIKIGGELLRSEAGAKIDIGGAVRTAVVGSFAVHGYAEKVKESTVECEVALAKGESVARFRDITDASIHFECDTGQVFVVRNAWLADPPVITEGEGGKIPLKFVGPPAEEQTT